MMMDLQSQCPGRRYRTGQVLQSDTGWAPQSSLILRRNAGDSQRNMWIPGVQIWVILRRSYQELRDSGWWKREQNPQWELPKGEAGSQASLCPWCIIHSRDRGGVGWGRGVGWGCGQEVRAGSAGRRGDLSGLGSGVGWGGQAGSTGRRGDLSCGRHTPFPSEQKPINSDPCENPPERVKTQLRRRPGNPHQTGETRVRWKTQC